ncbi:MAG: polysaccharide pyruvyl transferase family protein [Porticoccaceae bacterium]|nr:polysaccharide pyruvyl transferase family protein [Porticoccaceae bacterium]
MKTRKFINKVWPTEFEKDLKKYRNAEKIIYFWSKGNSSSPVYNFGDFLSLVVSGEIINRSKTRINCKKENFLFTIGSILHFAKNESVIWGSGINGKAPDCDYKFKELDVRMVRGKITEELLTSRGIKVGNSTYGDPALLLPTLFPKLKSSSKIGKAIAIPNLNELDICTKLAPKSIDVISPLLHWRYILKEILSCEIVLTSSLHGLILAEAFNVPVRLYKPSTSETLLKYKDYLSGTGRENQIDIVAPTFYEAFSIHDGASFTQPLFDPKEMLNTFPYDILNNER